MDQTLKVGSLFSGVGGFDLGFEAAGFEVAWQCEIDKNARRILRARWPKVPCHRDVKRIGKHNLAPVDVLAAGFPCQDVSIAGMRAGLAGARTSLFFQAVRIAVELNIPVVLLENVPGLFISNRGLDFAIVVKTLVDSGYSVAWRVLDSRYFGVAQRRRRVFIVGCLGADAERASQILFDFASSEGDSEAVGRLGRDLTAASREGAPSDNWRNGVKAVSNTLTAVMNSRDSDNNPQYLQVVDPDALPVAYVPKAALPLTQKYSGIRSANLIDQTPDTPGRAIRSEEAFSLISSSFQKNLVAEGLEPQQVVADEQEDQALLEEGIIMPILDELHGDDSGDMGLVSCTLDAHSSHASNQWIKQHTKRLEHMAQAGTGVRRFTPLECERLQGFPEGWTCLCSAKGNTMKCRCADTPRYKQMGNAVSVPVIAWIARRIRTTFSVAE